MRFDGIYVPLVTPFDGKGDIDQRKLETLVEAMLGKGVAGLVACGTTGEYYALSDTERSLVLQTVQRVAGQRVTLIAGIGDFSTRGSIERAAQAKALGYDALMLSPPPYSLPAQDGIRAHFEQAAAHCALPIILYNFPARTGVNIEFDTVAALARHPNIVAIKESSGNFSQALRMLQAGFTDFEVICGCDDQPIDYFFWGARAWIAGAANVFPGEQVALHKAARAGDWERARELMRAMYPALHSMESGDYNQKAKAGCLNASLDAGEVRLPLLPLDPAERQAFVDLVWGA
ncbi:MAG: 4-hydroxy-tetrahydrodipicolinate synthase [Dokdonella sp.]|uniref:4-hydroxy-tetrahydrodipicolinate synthase n=1 Tax=Dokdonella sp. TaxID=2291710 RepID=UPI0025B9725B|nr:4-hydroxy-tetrahydrodipicolinate synthase [Dokdonella sp.]MBZ0224026.1 4-hydroxy-tetrahydrodipicolinate synthase [Dokdonella sp.]